MLLEISVNSLPIIAGTLAAFVHVISGPDHLAAVLPLAVENYKKAWKIGLGWGLGHILGMLLIGLLFIGFKEVIPVETISSHSEFLVGFVLIFVGLWAYYRIFKGNKKHVHLHAHHENTDYYHIHGHKHEHSGTHHHQHSKDKKQGVFSAFLVGTLHGLAGIAHFIIFIPALGLTTLSQTIFYLIGFAIGTLAAMISFAIAMGKTAQLSDFNHNDNLFKGIRIAAGSIAIIVGIFWIFFA